MGFNIISAAEAASYIKHGYNIGLSGFTPAGTPKAVTPEVAKIAEEEHAKGNPFQISIFTGASTGDADGDEHHRLHPEGRHHKAAEQRGRTAHREPDGDEIQRHGLENDEADGGQQPKNGVNRHQSSLLCGCLPSL